MMEKDKTTKTLDELFKGYKPSFFEENLIWPIENFFENASYFFRRKIKYFFQRGKRGWAEEDTWDLGYYLCDVIAGSVGHLRKHTIGYPSYKGLTFNKWKGIMKDMETGFKAGGQLWDYTLPTKKQKRLNKEYEKGAKLFCKYLLALWD